MKGKVYCLVDVFTDKCVGFFNSLSEDDYRRFVKQNFTESFKKNPSSLDGLQIWLLHDWDLEEACQCPTVVGAVASIVSELVA